MKMLYVCCIVPTIAPLINKKDLIMGFKLIKKERKIVLAVTEYGLSHSKELLN